MDERAGGSDPCNLGPWNDLAKLVRLCYCTVLSRFVAGLGSLSSIRFKREWCRRSYPPHNTDRLKAPKRSKRGCSICTVQYCTWGEQTKGPSVSDRDGIRVCALEYCTDHRQIKSRYYGGWL